MKAATLWQRMLPLRVREWWLRLVRPQQVFRLVNRALRPLVVFFTLAEYRIHPAYGMTWRRKFRLGRELYRASAAIRNGTSYRAHIAMASKILQFAPEQEGVVVECGCWQGGSTACLSIICDYAGRELIVYDSFQGLPEADPRDAIARPRQKGMFSTPVEKVRENVRRHGVLERCTFRPGWFEDTLPQHREPVLLAYLDVDFQKSLHECVLHLWPHLVATGYVFIDEYTKLNYCALFWSERWWRHYFDRTPPGLLGSGSGIGLGGFWVGPFEGRFGVCPSRPYQRPASVGYTRKDLDGSWGFFPDD